MGDLGAVVFRTTLGNRTVWKARVTAVRPGTLVTMRPRVGVCIAMGPAGTLVRVAMSAVTFSQGRRCLDAHREYWSGLHRGCVEKE